MPTHGWIPSSSSRLVLDPALPAFPGDHTQQDLFDIQEEAKIYAQSHMEHYRFTRCFSPLCPEGELGDVHTSTVQTVITKEQFDLAQKNQWPQDEHEVRALLNITGVGLA